MKETGKRQFIFKKAYEISYAVFRVGSRISNSALKEHLERQALSLLDAATVENYAWVSTVARAIEYLIRFGSDVGLVHEANAETIISQLGSMNAAVAGPEKAATAEEVPLGDIFSGHEALFKNSGGKSGNGSIESGNGESGNGESGNVNNPAIHSAIHPAMNPASNAAEPGNRQTAILDRIRQSGNCRIKDIQDLLPGSSERTIRYDLQSLIEQNLVERVGMGGPSVFYRIRQPGG